MTEQKPQLNPMLKLLLDIGPLVLFFFANARPHLFAPLLSPFLPAAELAGERAGIFVATGVFMVAVLAALVVSYVRTRHLPIMPIVTAAVVLVFGTLTLVLQNDMFIKLKPTIIYVLFGGTLMIGQLFGKSFLSVVFDTVFNLTEEGWRKLTWRWAWFFLFMAAINELVWRTQSTDFWVSFKLFGAIPLTMIFGAMQIRLLQQYDAGSADAEKDPQNKRHRQGLPVP